MGELQNIFNNREIAIGIWVSLAVIISIFTKPVKQFLKSIIPRLFVVNLLFFISYFYFIYAW